MNGLFARARSFWRGLRRPGQLEAEMDEEMSFHIEMETDRLARDRKLDPREARRQAAAAFGGRDRYKEEGRDVRGLTGVTGLSLDVKLARRMLVKSPGLTLVGGVGMAVAIAVGAAAFIFMHNLISPRLPLDEGERIVAIENWNVELRDEDRRQLHDLAAWRAGMTTVEQISAFRMVEREVVGGGILPARTYVAEMTASAFRAARVPPLLGRYLLEGDEREGAPRVVVIGYDVWQSRMGGDRGVLGRELLIGDSSHTVVGVMPRGFSFPMDHSAWTPLRAGATPPGPREGPEIFVFGRLAPGATEEEAQAELTALGARAAAASPATHARLRPQLLPYTYPLDDIQDMTLWSAASMQLLVNLLLVAVAVNVAVLVYARTATRRGEIAVRSALGASRRRIVTQLFVEALLLSGGAAAVGLLMAHAALRTVKLQMERAMPVGFWVDFGFDPGAIAFVAGLAVLAAVIVGVVPALQSTGRQLQTDLRRVGGGSGRGLGRTWTTLIVAQVAIAVAVLPAAVNIGWKEIRHVAVRPTFPAEEFLGAHLDLPTELRPGMDAEAYRRESAARFGDRLTELLRRVEAEPMVAGASFTADLPGRRNMIRVDGIPAPAGSPEGHSVATVGVGPGYLQLLGARTLMGRPFHSGDPAGNAVVVSRSFTHHLLAGESGLGRRIRFATPPGEEPSGGAAVERWHEIAGVVEDLRANPVERDLVPSYLYYPVAPGQVRSASLLVRVRGGNAESFAPRLRELAVTLDPALQLGAVRSLATVVRPPVVRLIEAVILLVIATVILLSAAGIHALMSFTVTQRRKEIGIRAALGARPRLLLAGIFSRAMGQLALGAGIGCVLGSALLMRGSPAAGHTVALVGIVVVLMLGAGLVATVGPARRGLRIQPMDALRED
jgi:predicted permease